MAISDFKVNSLVRSVLARHWIDLQRVRYATFRGTVRIRGNLSRLGAGDRPQLTPADLEIFEHEIRRIRGANRVCFELRNWRKDATGRWQQNEGKANRYAGAKVYCEESQIRTFSGKPDSEKETDPDGDDGGGDLGGGGMRGGRGLGGGGGGDASRFAGRN